MRFCETPVISHLRISRILMVCGRVMTNIRKANQRWNVLFVLKGHCIHSKKYSNWCLDTAKKKDRCFLTHFTLFAVSSSAQLFHGWTHLPSSAFFILLIEHTSAGGLFAVLQNFIVNVKPPGELNNKKNFMIIPSKVYWNEDTPTTYNTLNNVVLWFVSFAL